MNWQEVLKKRLAPPAPVALVAAPASPPVVAIVKVLCCHQCHRPLQLDGACWKCHDRLCQECRRRWTGSAFIAVCRPCEIEECRRKGEPY